MCEIGKQLQSLSGTTTTVVSEMLNNKCDEVDVLTQLPPVITKSSDEFGYSNVSADLASTRMNVDVPDNDVLPPTSNHYLSSDLEFSMPSSIFLEDVSLEDFVDTVTTYKCKFCSFSCGWKSGLLCHIRSAHVANSLSDSSSTVPFNDETHELNNTSTVVESTTESPEYTFDGTTPNASLNSFETENWTQETTTHEAQIFLCGRCHQVFLNLEACHGHMLKEHPLEMGNKKVNKVKCKVNNKLKPTSLNNGSKSTTADVDNDNYYAETKSKRKVRPPKSLCKDYLMKLTKRNYIKRQQNDGKCHKCQSKGCHQQYKSKQILEYHQKCHVSDEHLFKCPECCEHLNHWPEMVMHLWKIHEIDMELQSCDVCPYRHYSISTMNNHLLIHKDERSFKCETCGKAFKQRSQLKNHEIVHLNRKSCTQKRWFTKQKCNLCERTFSDSKSLKKHILAVHKKLKPYLCPYCGHSSARKSMLELHLRQHTGDKPFTCDLCSYSTCDHNSLRRHKMRHSGLKPYQCPHCPYACIQTVSYKEHIRKKHPDISNVDGFFCCSICTFRSVNKENYKTHIAIHEQQRFQENTSQLSPDSSKTPVKKPA